MDELNLDTMTSTELQIYVDNLNLLLEKEREIGRQLALKVAQQVQTCWDIFNES